MFHKVRRLLFGTGFVAIALLSFFGARVLSDPIALRPATIDLGPVRGKYVAAKIEMVNYAPWSYNVAGASTACDCLAVEGVPTTVPAFGSTVLNVRVDLTGVEGKITREGCFIVPHASRTHLWFVVHMEVVNEQSAKELPVEESATKL
jgi:hypothetical protein